MFEDVLLDALSVVSTSRKHDFARTTAALSTIEGGLLVLIAGRLSVDAARELATARRHGRQGIAILLAVSTWATPAGRPWQAGDTEHHDRPGQHDPGRQDSQHDQPSHNGTRPRNGHGGKNGRGPAAATTDTAASARAPGVPPSGGGQTAGVNGVSRPGAQENGAAETAAAAAVLRAAGWRVITVDAATPLAVAWQQLPRGGGTPLAGERAFGVPAR